jgi:hypothetical protein
MLKQAQWHTPVCISLLAAFQPDDFNLGRRRDVMHKAI